MKNKVVVRIGGKDYTIVGQESDNYMQQVALYIDKKMKKITQDNSKLSTAMASVLTAINVADDYFKIQEAYDELEDEYSTLIASEEKLQNENEELLRKIDRIQEKLKDSEMKIVRLETENNRR